MLIRTLGGCCGIREIDQLSYGVGPTESDAPADKLWECARASNAAQPTIPRKCRYFIFSQAWSKHSGQDETCTTGYGFAFAQFLRDQNLGEVIDAIPAGVNPNSNNFVKMWTWIPDWKAVAAWVQAESIRRQYVGPAPLTEDSVASTDCVPYPAVSAVSGAFNAPHEDGIRRDPPVVGPEVVRPIAQEVWDAQQRQAATYEEAAQRMIRAESFCPPVQRSRYQEAMQRLRREFTQDRPNQGGLNR